MIPWERRPLEIAHLLNPAFCGEVLRRCVVTYTSNATRPMPYALSFLVLPIVLHPPTRALIATRQRQFHAWLQQHPELKISFAERSRDLIPITREAITFLLQVGALALDDQGDLAAVGSTARSATTSDQNQETTDCYNKAATLGRLFAHAGTTATIYTMWGVKP